MKSIRFFFILMLFSCLIFFQITEAATFVTVEDYLNGWHAKNLTFRWALTGADYIEYYIDSNAPQQTTTGTVKIDTHLLNNSHTLTVKAYKAPGGIIGAQELGSQSFSLKFDNTLPNPPKNLNATIIYGNSTKSYIEVAFSLATDPISGIEGYAYTISKSPETPLMTYDPNKTDATGSHWFGNSTWLKGSQIPFSGIDKGDYYLNLIAVDKAGNNSSAISTKFSVDFLNRKPIISLSSSSHPDNTIWYKNPSAIIKIKLEEGSTTSLKHHFLVSSTNNKTETDLKNISAINWTNPPQEETLSPKIVSGKNYIYALAVNNIGYSNLTYYEINFDDLAPEIKITADVPEKIFTDKTGANLTWSITDLPSQNNSGLKQIYYVLYPLNPLSDPQTNLFQDKYKIDNTKTTETINFTSGPGAYYVYLGAEDNLGNRSYKTYTIYYKTTLALITDITITSPTNHNKDSWSSKTPAEFTYAAKLTAGAQLATKPYFYIVTKTSRTSQLIIDEAKKKEKENTLNLIATLYNNAETLYGPTDIETINYFDPQKINMISGSPYNGQWYLYVVAKDSQDSYFSKEYKFGIDMLKPKVTFIIEGGKQYTNKEEVSLTITPTALSPIKKMDIMNYIADPALAAGFNPSAHTNVTHFSAFSSPQKWKLSTYNGIEGKKIVGVAVANETEEWSNIEIASIEVDTTPPTASANFPRTLYIKDKGTISWNAEDKGISPSGLGETQIIKSTIFGGLPFPVTFQTVKAGEKSFTFEKMPEEKIDFRLDIYDKAGNYTLLQYKNISYYTLIIDRTPPDISINKSNLKIEGALEENNRFIIGSKEFTIKWAPGTDTLSGIEKYVIQFKREGEPDAFYELPDRTLSTIAFDKNKNEYAEKITLPYEGYFLLKLLAIDKCGNIGTFVSKLIDVDPNTLIQKFSLTEYPKSPKYAIDFELALNSNLSQFFGLYLEGNPKPLDEGSGSTSSKSFENIITPLKEGKYKFTLKVLDKKNLTTTIEKTVTIDTTPPNAIDTIKAYADSSKKDIIEENKSYGYENPYFEWTAPADNLSGIQGYLVSISEDSKKEPTDTITDIKYQAKNLVSGKTYYLNVKALDNAGLSSAIKTFTYAMPQPESIQIKDKGISIVRGAKFTFSAKAYDNKNQEIIGYSSFSWEKTEGEGDINKDTGEFTASNTLGKVKIKAASDNGKTDEIEINITEEPVKIEIDPAQGAKTATDQSFTFTVIGKDAANNTVIINPSWTASPAPANIQGSGNQGIFSANQKGTYTVSAQYKQLKASANIEVYQADHTPPDSFNLLEPSNQKRINKEEPITLKWELTKDDPNGSGMDKYEIMLNGTKIGETDTKTNTYTIPAKDLKDGTYTWIVAAFDKLGNKREAAPFTFIVNIKGPIITVKIDNREVNNGDIINANPKFTIELQDPNGVKKDSIKLTLNGKAVSQGLSIQSASSASDINIIAAYAPTEKLSEGKNTLFIEAYDTENYKTEREINDLTVMAGLSIIGSPRNYPNPFKPSSGESTNIVYTLSQDAEITLYLYNIAGEQVWRKALLPGQEGAHPGENSVAWNGKDFSNEIVGNGVYLLAITSGGKVLARGEIAVFE